MNPKHQSALAHLKERLSAHPRAVLVAVEIEHLKQLDSLITELEADGKRLDWMSIKGNSDRIKNKGPGFYYVDVGGGLSLIKTTLRQAIDAAMKGAV